MILKKIDHPNIMKIIEYYTTQKHIYIVSEYLVGGELFDRIAAQSSFNEYIGSQYMRQMLSAVCYLHQKKIIHRDLKPENAIFESKSADSQLKIIDFGTCRKLTDTEKCHNRLGTSYYIAPEVLKGEYDFKCDVWSLGVIMYILLFGKPPFNAKTDEEIFEKVLIGKYTFPDSPKISDESKEIIGSMLQMDPKMRPTAEAILQRPWFQRSLQFTSPKQGTHVLEQLRTFKVQTAFQKAILIYFVKVFNLKKEKEELLKTFEELDLNHDGSLSKEEIKLAFQKRGASFEEELPQGIFDRLDIDSNNRIDFSEFLLATVNYKLQIHKKELKQIFDIIDTDHSGQLSLEELRQFFNIQGKENEEKLKKLIENIDTNHDGMISFEEFSEAMSEFMAHD